MKKRRLCGNVLVNPMGFGGIPIQRISEKEASAVLNACLDKGINFIDTARGYTDSEEKIGKAVSYRKKEFYVATKTLDRTKQGAMQDIKTSLKNLKIKKIDLYQLHNIGNQDDFERIMKADGAYSGLKEAKETGLIGHIGVTGHKPEFILKAIETGRFETIQIPFNIIEKQFAKVIEKADEAGIGTIIMKPLAGGAFKNSEAALKWVMSQKVSVVIPGMQSLEEANKNSALAENYELTKDESERLAKEAKSMDKNICRRCEYCLRVCPQGIDITKTLLFHAYYKRYDLKEWAKKRYESVVKVKPDQCTECGACEKECPYGLPIRKMLKEAREDMG